MDNTKAAALAIAERKLISLGWRFSLEDVGRSADVIIGAMEKAEAERKPTKGNGNG